MGRRSHETGAPAGSHVADLSRMAYVEVLAQAVSGKHARPDVLSNNAGILRTPDRLHTGRVGFAIRGQRACAVFAEQALMRCKLAITETSRLKRPLANGLAVIAVNPVSVLASEMVKDAFCVASGDIRVGAEIFQRAALADECSSVSGQYFNNKGMFGSPHTDALDPRICEEIVRAIKMVLAGLAI